MNLYLVANKQYVLSDGIAGAIYLTNLFNESTKLIVENATEEFNPRCIGTDEALKLINKLKD